MDSILVATDLSPRTERAILRGSLLARATGAQLHLLHVVDEEQPQAGIQADREAAEAYLARQVAGIVAADGISCTHQIAVGGTFVEMTEVAREHRAGMLIVGPHYRSLLKDIFVATTAERAIRKSQVPVLVVNGEEIAPYREILVAVDLSEPSAAAIHALAALRLGVGASISVLHAFEAPETSLIQRPSVPADEVARRLPALQAEADRALAGFLDGLPIQPARRIAQLVDTTVPETIQGVAAAIGADLIVVGTLGRAGLAKVLFGSTAQAVLRTAVVDVLAVPPRAV